MLFILARSRLQDSGKARFEKISATAPFSPHPVPLISALPFLIFVRSLLSESLEQAILTTIIHRFKRWVALIALFNSLDRRAGSLVFQCSNLLFI